MSMIAGIISNLQKNNRDYSQIMSPSEHSVVIIGAGMSGMLAASYIQTYYPSAKVTILEQSSAPGGLYRGLDIPGIGHCDHAMRMIYETGYGALDCVIRSILPEDDWHIYPDNEKDIAGIYWNASLQSWSPYMDLRRLPQAQYRACEQEIRNCIANASSQTAENALDYVQDRFGPHASMYLQKALEKLYQVPAHLLDISALAQPAMNRVVLYDEETLAPLLTDAKLRSMIAWPNQLTLPVKRVPSQAGLYPKQFGMHHVIDALYEKLCQQGVVFHFECEVLSMDVQGGNVLSFTGSNGQSFENPSLVIAANGLQPACQLLNIDTSLLPSPPPSWLVYLRLASLPDMQNLYHFYCLDEGYATFRVTHYYNYCPDAYQDGYPLCIELWSQDSDKQGAIARALFELRQMGILHSDDVILASAAIPTRNYHAHCTLEYTNSIDHIRQQAKAAQPENMQIIGPFCEPGVLLLYDVWRDMYQKLERTFPA